MQWLSPHNCCLRPLDENIILEGTIFLYNFVPKSNKKNSLCTHPNIDIVHNGATFKLLSNLNGQTLMNVESVKKRYAHFCLGIEHNLQFCNIWYNYSNL